MCCSICLVGPDISNVQVANTTCDMLDTDTLFGDTNISVPVKYIGYPLYWSNPNDMKNLTHTNSNSKSL